MKRTTLATLVTLLVAALYPTSAAHAQCCVSEYDHYRYESYYFAYGPIEHAYAFVPPPRWAAGLHFTGLTINHRIGDEAAALGGLGGHLRYRGFRWGAELAFDVLARSYAEGGVEQVSVPVQVSGLFYLVPRGRLNVFALAGLRAVPTFVRWQLSNLRTDQHFFDFGLHAGLGAELIVSRYFAFTGDVRAFGTTRKDSGPDGGYYAGVERPVVAEKSLGLSLSLGGSLRF